MSPIDAALARSRTVIATLVLLLIAGTSAFINIPKESEPDIDIPIIYVSLVHKGISPEDSERLLIRPMETELRGVEGLKELRATAFEGGASVILEFEAGFDSKKALDDVREKVDVAKTDLPDDTDEPSVNEVNLSLFPVLVVGLSGNVPERTLLRLARNLRDQIETLPAVLEVKIGGERDEQVEILIDPALVESYGLDARQVLSNIAQSNKLVAAGALDTGAGRFSVKVPGLFESVNDILDMPLKISGDAAVTVRDIATVRRTFKDPEAFARMNGKPALTLEVSKRSGENIIDTITKVRALVESERETWPPAIEVTYSQDKSSVIRDMLNDLQNNVLAAVLLVMIVVVAALGIRSGLLVGVAIPGSFLTAILVLSISGLTVNMVVLFSLILAVGMLVDGAIVVTEFADRRMIEGADRRTAYAEAAKRMSWPIIASTATTLAAFTPLLFWPGVMGEFMKYLPLTLIATLSASLLMALIFVPTIGALVGRASTRDERTLRATAAGESGDLHAIPGFTGAYIATLRRALHHPGKVIAASLLVLISAWVVYFNLGHGVEFLPEVEPEQAIIQIHARGNLSVWEKDALVREVEDQVLAIGNERDEFRTVYTLTGAADRRDDEQQDIIGTILLEFTDWDKRRKADAIFADIRARTKQLAGIIVETRKPDPGPPIGKPVQLQLTSRDPGQLHIATEKLRALFDETAGLRDIEDGRPIPGIEWELTVDRAQAAKFGADVTLIGHAINMVTKGLEITEYRPDDTDEEIDIVARHPVDDRTTDQLDKIRVQTDLGLVPISNFVKRVPRQKTDVLRRVDGRRAMSIKSELDPGVLADAKVAEIRARLADTDLPPGIEFEFKGENEEQAEAQAFLGNAFGIALFMMAIILVTQFNSFYSAFLIMSAVIMSTIGVMLGLLVIGQPFGIVMSGIGVIALAGIVVNNNIVLIDTYDRIKKTVEDPIEAVLRTGAQRLRPVLLTTITTALGLMPMVLGVNLDFVSREILVGSPSTQWWVQLSTAIVCGLMFATILTLVVTPSALVFRANLHAWRVKRQGARTAPLTP